MHHLKNIPIRILLLITAILEFKLTYSQTNCNIFTEYKDEIKIWAAATIDSLEKQGVDTVLFYGIGSPETGRTYYGKIVWAIKGAVTKVEVNCKYYDGAFHLGILNHDSNASFEAIQFYSDYRLDTVNTNPKEVYWQSHDFLHYVYSKIHGTEVCFTAEDYLLRSDPTHLRTKWIKKLNESTTPYEHWPYKGN